MKWKEITVTTCEQGIEPVIARLDMLGISQINVVQGHDEIDSILRVQEKYWDYADESVLNKQPAVQAFISLESDADEIEKAIIDSMHELKNMEADIGVQLGSLEVKSRIVDEEDWANNWKAFFKPINVGEKLLVCPSWENIPEDNVRAVLKIDPGMAFGTGTHQTTGMCLELLEANIKQGDTVADLGCGSGILSIAATLLGASKTFAIDIDPVAAKVAAENAQLNGINMENYNIKIGDILEDVDFRNDIATSPCDIVMANIVANVIIALSPAISPILKDDGIFIASGIIDERLDEVVASLESVGLKIIEIKQRDDWRAILAVKDRI